MVHDDGDAGERRASGRTDALADEPTDSRVGVAFLIGFLVGIVLLGLGWVTVSVTGESVDAGGSASQGRVGDPASGSPSAAAGSVAATRMERCISAAHALGAPLRMAVPAMDQWEVHVGAMNQLVVGTITLQQATAFWNQTRVGALRRIAHFDHALATLLRHGVDCPRPRLLSAVSPRLHSCTRQVAADVRVLRAARTSVATWDKHVHDMDMLRMGTLSPAAATEKWLSIWQRGIRELERYRVAARAAQHAPGCETQAMPGALPSGPSESGHPSMRMGPTR